MDVHKLTTEERFEADLISMIAFHMRIEDPEKVRVKSEKKTEEDWGAFSKNGKMMARIVNNHFESWIDGHLVRNGGIGAVSTLPEYRNAGAIREIFKRLLPEAYLHEEVISTLYPFNHAFYRKFGYETACWRHDYEFHPGILCGYQFSGDAEMWKPGDSVCEYTALYNRFASSFNLAMLRDDERMLSDHLKGEYYKDRKFGYLLREEKKPIAYLIFQDVQGNSGAVLSVEDLAWDGRKGLNAILGFLARFSADYAMIRLFLPASFELLSIIQSPRAYEIRQTVRQDYMIRVINVKRMLEIIAKPANCHFVVRIEDELLSENNGTWAVNQETAILTSEEPDLTLSIQAFSQLATGCVSLSEALYRNDVTLFSNRDHLEKVFIRKPIFVEERF